MKKLFFCGLLLNLVCWAGSAAELNWMTDLPAAQAKAKQEKKLVLVDFTGSDWCGWCIKLNQEVFSTKQFADFAKDNLVLVEADFPNKKKLPPDQVKGFPTIILLNPEGKTLWTQVGYMRGGPKAWIAEIEKHTGPKSS